jgi:hypothetical protein
MVGSRCSGRVGSRVRHPRLGAAVALGQLLLQDHTGNPGGNDDREKGDRGQRSPSSLATMIRDERFGFCSPRRDCDWRELECAAAGILLAHRALRDVRKLGAGGGRKVGVYEGELGTDRIV